MTQVTLTRKARAVQSHGARARSQAVRPACGRRVRRATCKSVRQAFPPAVVGEQRGRRTPVSLSITDHEITGTSTAHKAVHTHDGQWGWHVTWLPGRDLGKFDAAAAIHLADLVALGVADPEQALLAAHLAAQLGLSYFNALQAIRETAPKLVL